MTKFAHVDMDQIEAAIARGKAAMEGRAAGHDLKAAQARMSIAVSQQFMRQMAVEINRGTTPKMLGEALASACSNMIHSYAASVADERNPIAMGVVIQGVLNTLTEFLNMHFDGRAEEVVRENVAMQEGGRA